MMATIGTSPVPLAVWTVTTKEYQVKLSCTYIVHTWVSCLVCSVWFRIRQCRNLNFDTHGLIHHHSKSNVLPPFKHAGISMRLAWDHACSQTPATGFDSGFGPAPLFQVVRNSALYHFDRHRWLGCSSIEPDTFRTWGGGPGSTDRLP